MVSTDDACDEVDLACALVSPNIIFDAARLNKVSNQITRQTDSWARRILDPLRQDFETVKFRTMMQNHSSMSVSQRAHQALADAKINHVIYKGPFQQTLLYGSPFTKPSADTDLLVAPRDQPEAHDILASLGFTCEEAHAWWWRRFLNEVHLRDDGGGMIDLHHGLGQAGLPDVQNTSAFIERAISYSASGMTVPILDKIDATLIASYSIAKAFLSREPCLGTLLDFKTGHDALSADQHAELLARAKTHGLFNIVDFACAVSAATFETKMNNSTVFGLKNSALASMVVTPWSEELLWPKRRQILRLLSDGPALRTFQETCWAAAAHISRSYLDRNRRLA